MTLLSIREKFFENRPFAPNDREVIENNPFTMQYLRVRNEPRNSTLPDYIPLWASFSYNYLSFACNFHNSIMQSDQNGLTKFVEVLTLSMFTGSCLALFAIAETCLRIALDILLGSFVAYLGIIATCLRIATDILGNDAMTDLNIFFEFELGIPCYLNLIKLFEGHVISFLTIIEAPKIAYRMLTEYQTMCRPKFEMKPYSFLPALPLFDILRGIQFSGSYEVRIDSDNVDWESLKNDPRLRNVTKMHGGLDITSFSLPEGLQLPNLERLNLSYCRSLSYLDWSIYRLPPSCTVNLTGTGLSQVNLDRIMQESSRPGYNGPRFSLSRASTIRDLPIGSLQESVTVIDQHSGLPPLAYNNIERLQENVPDLREWLSRLSDIFEATSVTKHKASLYSAITKMLCLASEDSDELSKPMLEALKSHIPSALTSCGDRMALSVIYLDLFRQSLVIDKSNLKAYANFIIKGQWTIELLEEIARQKVRTIRGYFDEIEVYLAYPILLKEKLELPICLNRMRYLGCSGIENIPEAMETAVEHVNLMTGGIENKIRYLLQHAEFKTAYKQCYPEKVREANDKACAAAPSECENVLNNELAKHLASILFS